MDNDTPYERDTTDLPVDTDDSAYLSKYESGRKAGTRGGPQVVSNEAGENEGVNAMSSEVMDSDAQLARDEREAIDEGNILKGGRTRGAGKGKNYREPGDTEGLPGRDDSGSSSLRTGQI